MSNGLIIGSLAVAFLVLAQGAELLVSNIRLLARHLQLNIFFLGLILGLFTSMPELMLSISAAHSGLGKVSLGNLLGGILVLFGLVLGLAVIFNRRIKTDGRLANVLPGPLLFLLPLILGLKGWLNRWDGVVIILAYLAIVYNNLNQHRPLAANSHRVLLVATDKPVNSFFHFWTTKLSLFINHCQHIKLGRLLNNRHFWLATLGFGLIVGASQLITNLSAVLLSRLNLPQLLIGVLVFSIGTNLPEIAVTFRALINKASELSISYLLGSAISNILIIGILLQFGTLSTQPLLSYGLIAGAICLISSLFLLFYKTGKCFQRWEGWVLLAVYAAFWASQLIWAI
jgi:cation:H+ antiporter